MKKLIKKILERKHIFFLIVLSVILMGSTIRYGLRTYKVPEWDEQHYMRMATEFYRLVKYHLSLSTPYDMLQVVPFRQPGYPLIILLFLLVFGLSKAYFWGIFTNGLLYVASIFGIYFIARNFLSKTSSFTASVLFAFYGWTQLHLYLTYSETASSVFIIWTIFFLIKSNLFQNKKYSLFFGLFLGFGLLVRWIIVIYVFAPFLYVLYKLFKKHLFKKKIVSNIGFSFLIAFLISFYPYFQNYYWIFHYFSSVGVGSQVLQALPQKETNPISLYSLTFYLNTFAQLGIFFFILIVIGFIFAFKKKSHIKPILLTVITGYLFSVIAPIKGERYIIPIFPYLAILSASVFDYIKNRRVYVFLVFFTIILSLASFLGGTWGKGSMKESLVSLPISLPFGQLNKIYLTTYSRPPYIYKISGKEILDFIQKDSKENGIRDPQALSLFYYRPLDEPLMTYNLYNFDNPLSINNFVGTLITDPIKDAAYLSKVIVNSDYILTKTDQKLDNSFSKDNYQTLRALIIFFDNNAYLRQYYKEERRVWINQDSSEVSIYRRVKQFSETDLEDIRIRLIDILKSIDES